MERVLFLMRYPIDESYNLKLKFMGQMRACANLGYDVSYIGYDKNNYFLISLNGGSKIKVAKTHFHRLNNYRSTVAIFDLYSALAKTLKNNVFDYIYMRKKLVTSKAIKLLKKHKNYGGKLIVEIPSFGVEEASLGLIRNLAIRFFAKYNKQFEEFVDLYTLIGNNCPSSFKGKPSMEIVNGVSLDIIPVKKQQELYSEIHMIALASMRDWQGFDRVILGMSKYSGNERLILHLVGQDFDGSVHRWMEKAEELNISCNVIDHGPLYSEQLTQVFDTCHLAIGALALHRRGGLVASALKVREYTARGIPFIYAYDDSALDGTEWFALRFPSEDEEIDFNRVIPWLKDIYARKNVAREIRQFAVEHMSWEEQFSRVFSYIQGVKK